VVKKPILPETGSGPTLRELRGDFRTSLVARNLSPRTITSYLEALDRLVAYLDAQAMPAEIDAIRRQHVEAFMGDLAARHKAATAANRYAGLRAFFLWCEEEELVEASPMAKMKKPMIPEERPAVLTDAEVAQLRKACEGSAYDDQRDAAILAVFLSTGARLAEVAALDLADYDRDRLVVTIREGKGRRSRQVTIAPEDARLLNRYLRARTRHPAAGNAGLWLGQRGRMTPSGIAQVIQSRGAEIPGMHPHRLRHHRAHQLMASGMTEGNIMVLMGWRSREMLGRYASALANDRALDAAREFEARQRQR